VVKQHNAKIRVDRVNRKILKLVDITRIKADKRGEKGEQQSGYCRKKGEENFRKRGREYTMLKEERGKYISNYSLIQNTCETVKPKPRTRRRMMSSGIDFYPPSTKGGRRRNNCARTHLNPLAPSTKSDGEKSGMEQI